MLLGHEVDKVIHFKHPQLQFRVVTVIHFRIKGQTHGYKFLV